MITPPTQNFANTILPQNTLQPPQILNMHRDIQYILTREQNMLINFHLNGAKLSKKLIPINNSSLIEKRARFKSTQASKP